MNVRPNNSTLVGFKSILIFSWAEFQRNLLSFLLPLPAFIGMQTFFWIQGTRTLEGYAIWSLLIGAALLAMIYGLQSFSNDADKKTLDFILTRPLSPYLIISVKYFLSLMILSGWFVLFGLTAHFSLRHLPLGEGMGLEWIILILLTIHSISFFSGLLAKGLERFFVVTVLTGVLTGNSYYLWQSVFELVKANYFWFDIPPYQLHFLATEFPVYLMLLCLATPFIGTIWYLRSRIPLHRLSPFKWLAGFWLGSFLLVRLANALLAPTLWPDPNALSGDWHDQGGLILCSSLQSASNVSAKYTHLSLPCQITLAHPGQKSHFIYRGVNLLKPRFSPDGSRIVFSENEVIKILTLQTRQLSVIGPGHTASWSADGSLLLCAQSLPNSHTSRFYLVNLHTKRKKDLGSKTIPLADFIWNSRNNTVYYLGLKDEVGSWNLNTQANCQYLPATNRDTPLNYYSIVHPTLLYNAATHQMIWGQVFEDELRIFELNPKTGKVTLAENIVHPRLKNGSPLLINNRFKAFLWQRTDGSFVSQTTHYYAHKNDHHADDEHEH